MNFYDVIILVVIFVLGVFLVIKGSKIQDRINENRFNRRNFAGMEEFEDYKSSKRTHLVEGFQEKGALALRAIGGIFIIFTILYLLISYLQK